MAKMNYKKAGVNIRKAEALVEWIKANNSFSVSSLGSDYAGLFSLPLGQYKDPVLAASTDGVGTKLKLAAYFSAWKGIGQDLVAMCVNDLICVGAKPLFFLDYYACEKLNKRQAKAFFIGLQQACEEALCPLLGGETAELPGLYKAPDIDCAGFCVGIVERSKILKPDNVCVGDDVIAFPSSGFHSNGYSLIRKIYKTSLDLKRNKRKLMEPTRLYTFLTPYMGNIKGLRAMAHITGGGLNNLSRIVPPHLAVSLDPWPFPSCFLDLKRKGRLLWRDMLQTFNCGLGLILIVRDKKEVFKAFPKEKIIDLGTVKKREQPLQSWSLDFKALAKKNS